MKGEASVDGNTVAAVRFTCALAGAGKEEG